MSATIEDLEARQAEIRGRLAQLDAEHAGAVMPEEARSEWNGLGEEHEANRARLDEMRARQDFLRDIAGDPVRQERGADFHTRNPRVDSDAIYDLVAIRNASRSPEDEARMLRDNAMRSVEQARFPHERASREDCQGHIEGLMERFAGDDERGGSQAEFARRILLTGSPTYKRAFGKTLLGRNLSPDEQRSLSLAAASGGYAVPYTLDPTVILTSNGQVNPLRQLGRVEQIMGNEWRGISSAGVTASYDAELAEVSDDTPSFAQPTANVEKAQAFIEYSIEIGEDWGALQSEMARLLQDAKDALEATKFVTGAGHGSNEPEGLLTGATGTVAAGTAAFAIAHLYALEEALPARWQANAAFLAHRGMYNRVRQFDTNGGAALWLRLADGIGRGAGGNTGHELLGYPAWQSSAYTNALTAGTKLMTIGDFSQFLIVDKIGMSVEIVPHLMGASRRPIGARGLYAYWRNTSDVLVASAFKTLVTT